MIFNGKKQHTDPLCPQRNKSITAGNITILCNYHNYYIITITTLTYQYQYLLSEVT